jgi:SAM-dependent methyltransferase
MIEIARRRVPGGDFRVGPMERLPWDDATFDLVTGFNAFQFAADPVAAIVEARRVARPGGRVAICAWSRSRDSDLLAVQKPVRELRPPAPPAPPRTLEELARHAGLEPGVTGEVDVPFEARDRPALERALLAPGAVAAAVAHSGEEAVRAALVEAAAPFRRADGSYRFENRFDYVIAPAG